MTVTEATTEPEPVEPLAAEPEEVPPRPRTRRRRRRRIGTALVLLVALGVALTVPFLVARAARTIANSTEGTTVDVPAEELPASLPSTPGSLVALVDDGELVGTAVLAVGPAGRGGSIVVLPAGTEATIPGVDRPGRLASAYEGGLDQLTETVEGLLEVSFAAAEEVDEARLAALLEPYGPFSIDLDDPILAAGPDGEDVVLAEAGADVVDAETLAELLFARRTAESELERLPHVSALWEAVVAAASARAVADPDPAAPPASTDEFVAAVLSGPGRVREVPVEAVLDPARNPDGVDLLAPDIAAIRLLMAQVLPGAVSPASAGIRVRILDPYGDGALLYEAVGRLSFSGASIVLVSPSGADAPPETIIEYQASITEDVAARYGPPVGDAVTRPAAEQIDGIDATIILGDSFRRHLAEERARETTTRATTTAVATTTEETD